MITEEEFLAKVDEMITPEDKNKYATTRKKMITRVFTWIPLEILACVLIFRVWGVQPITIVFGILIFFITVMMIVQSAKIQWDNLKSKYIHQIFKFILEGYKFKYEPNQFISKDIFKKTAYDCEFDEYHGEDLLKINIPNDDGTPSNVELQISDLLLKRIDKASEGKTIQISFGKNHAKMEEDVVTVFKGVLGYIEFPFEFTCGLALNKSIDGLNKINLEDVQFNKNFKTYTNNQLESLRILTPTMMEKLKNLYKWAEKLEMVFTKNKLYFKFPNNIFELNVKGKKFNSNVFLPVYHDLYNIVYLVEEVKNNNRIFKM